MLMLAGKGVSGGISIGKLKNYKRSRCDVDDLTVEDPETQLNRFYDARKQVSAQFEKIMQKAEKRVGDEEALIFRIQQAMLEDVDFEDSIINMIQNDNRTAEYAVKITALNYIRLFTSIEDADLRARATDIKDMSLKLLRVLTGCKQKTFFLYEPAIITSLDLFPSEAIQFDPANLLGFILENGSYNSHSAILARTMLIPAIVGINEETLAEYDGHSAIIDGYDGKIYIDPDESVLALYKDKQTQEEERRVLLRPLQGLESITTDGQKVKLCANVGHIADIDVALKNGADGVGLFRSEFLFLGRNEFPSEQEQYEAYLAAAEKMKNKTVVIRTLDIGADKQASYFNFPFEQNPALGYRAIRVSLDRPELFRTQLRAILRASAGGNIAVMFPLIVSVEETLKIKTIVEQTKIRLKKEGYLIDSNIPIGIMIETPAAAMISDLLAPLVDFFSIGTNDLIQYTLAVDRHNQKVEDIANPGHAAVLRLIRMTVDNAKRYGKWVSVCGEMGADPAFIETLVGIGVDEISLNPWSMLEIRQKIRSISAKQATLNLNF